MRSLPRSSHSARSTWRAVSLGALAALLAVACTESPTAPRVRGPAPGEAQPSLKLATDSLSTQNATYSPTDFLWSSGQAPVPLGSSKGFPVRACFLTYVGGMLGSTRFARVYVANDSWWLDGSASGVSARARCVNVYSYSGEYLWSQGQNPTFMGSIYGRGCFLTRAGGDFEGSGERVEVFSGNSTSWWLGGSSVHTGVHARARCVLFFPLGPQQPYSYTGWISSTSSPVIFQPSSWACFLAGMRGDFEGAASYVRTYLSGGSWYVKAGSQLGGLTTGVKAGCVS